MNIFSRNISSFFLSIALAMLFVIQSSAQNPFAGFTAREHERLRGGAGHFNQAKGDSIDPNSVPTGYFTWNVDERFGTVRPVRPDTLSHLFQNVNKTGGLYGEYNFTGSLGAPRVARIYNGRQDFMMASQFVFERPYNWFLVPTGRFVFTNTKSPVARLDYHSSGSKTDGDDHFIARFSTNINKRAGIGFNVDYSYARGYYKNQNHSSIDGSLYGYFRGDKYQAHGYYETDYIKNVENGGLQDERYITNPNYFPTRYGSSDMPVRLEGVRNTVSIDRAFFTHRLSAGYVQYLDSAGKEVHRSARQATNAATDSADMKKMQALSQDSTLTRRFVPVASLIHTVRAESNYRNFTSRKKLDDFFANFFTNGDAAADSTHYLTIQNTVALEMNEGFKKWVKTGMRLFAKHEFSRFTLPDVDLQQKATTFNYFTLGAQLLRENAHTLRYNVLGEMRTTGKDWGEFNIEGNVGLHFRMGKDTLSLVGGGYVRNESPAFYYNHYHGRNAWWDKDLDHIFRARVEGTLSYRANTLSVGIESVQNYAYFRETQTTEATTPDLAKMKYGVTVDQYNGNVQIASASFSNRWAWGPLHWENQLTLQKSSNDDVLPLPIFTGWSNVYLQFKIARVLATQLGADIRYFTEYYAPTYSPIIGQYAVQDATYRTKLGNYPWINAYINFKLKGVRFYLAYTHVNSSEGRSFLVPHYPTNQRLLHFGISWTFFN